MCRKLDRSLNKRKSHGTPDEPFTYLSNPAGAGDEVDNIDLFANEGDEDGDRMAAVGDEVRGGFDDQDSVASDELSGQEEAELSEEDDNINDSNTSDSKAAAISEGGGKGYDAESDFAAIRRQLLQEALGGGANKESDNAGSTSEPKSGSGIEAPPLEPLRALVLPLFATLPPERQRKVFETPPPGCRLIIVTTNVAETSLTIPGVRYVVDSGREKVKSFGEDPHGAGGVRSGIAKFEVKWISQASADQRKGRAGRTGPGHCYRLYSSTYFHQHMQLFRPPDICGSPLEDLVLQMRAIGIDRVESFPFPTPPPANTLRAAVDLLTNLGAMLSEAQEKRGRKKSSESSTTAMLRKMDQQLSGLQQLDDGPSLSGGGLTALGRLMVRFPINPRLAKMLILAHRADELAVTSHGEAAFPLLSLTLSLVSALTEPLLFSKHPTADRGDEEGDEDSEEGEDERAALEERQRRDRRLSHHPDGDSLARLHAVGAYLFLVRSGSPEEQESVRQLCSSQHLHLPALRKITELRAQLQRICHSVLLQAQTPQTLLDPPREPPSPQQEAALRQVLLAGFCDSIARRVPLSQLRGLLGNDQGQLSSRRLRLTAYLSCQPALMQQPLYIHPLSCLHRADPLAPLPEFVVYGELVRSSRGDRVYMASLTALSAAMKWIPEQAADCPLLKWGPPLSSPTPFYDAQQDSVLCYCVPRFGAQAWELTPALRALSAASHAGQTQVTTAVSTQLGYRKCDEVYRWFGRLLLEGAVVPGLGRLLRTDGLKHSPASLTQMKPIPAVSSLLTALVTEAVCSLAQLLRALQSNPSYLIAELQSFLRADVRKEFRSLWAQLAKSVAS
mmetsp:Transcript_18140/g.24898  ORF Transcript_18140/g.24898 Transcript_18140/m.24898 type:complete len:844 (+) Transcript_18140:1220-3751(+)